MNKFSLLAAAAASIIGGGAAQAQYAIPAAEIDGAGASLPANVQRQAFDCYGVKSPLAFSGAASSSNPITLFDFNFPAATGVTPTPANSFDCAVRVVQPNVTARYISTGSGAGISSFLFHSSPEAYPGSTVVLPEGFASYSYGVQFANSDNALSYANLNDTTNGYNFATLPAGKDKLGNDIPAGTAVSRYGPAIQIPVYLAPVAIDYSPVYAKERNGGGFINEYRFKVAGARADGSGGLKLTKAQYCGIMNGTITNWNQLPKTVVDKDPNDPLPFDVPIILAGRSESSGTTGLLTRALAAQCSGGDFTNSTSTLPSARRSGAVFNKGTTPTFSGSAEVVGKFTVANGNDGVAQLVAYHPDPSSTVGARTLNGRIGYNGPDFTLPAVLYTGQNNYGLNTASLQVGTGTTFVGPTAKDAAAAFTGIQPPQSKGTAGAYCTDPAAGVCQAAGGSATNPDGTRAKGDRSNPLHWVFPANKFLTDDTGAATTAANPLANPAKGYPIVGTSNVLLYTCYADAPTRQAVNGMFATFQGKTTRDSTGTTATSAIPTKLFSDPVKGVLARNGLAAMPAAWQTAIAETFLKSSTQVGIVGNATTKLGARNLWIQSAIPTTTAATTANPNCAGKPGA
jgi:ABC-type phosphate transport system substrate-binding protein